MSGNFKGAVQGGAKGAWNGTKVYGHHVALKPYAQPVVQGARGAKQGWSQPHAQTFQQTKNQLGAHNF